MKKMVIKTKNKKDFFELMSGLSNQRLELLWWIKEHSPDSVYELAKIVNKSQPYVQKELKFLEKKGFIVLKKTKINGRKRVAPIMEYNILSFEMEF